MKRNWELTELIEQWTLLPREIDLLGTKTGSTRLGCAVWLKFFQHEGKFPLSEREIPQVVITYIAKQVNVAPEEYQNYQGQGRNGRYHRTEILKFCGLRRHQSLDCEELVQWLNQNVLPYSLEFKTVEEATRQRWRELGLAPMPLKQWQRMIRSGIRTYETQWCEQVYQKLPAESRAALARLLISSQMKKAQIEGSDAAKQETSLFTFLNNDPGSASLNSLMEEIEKLLVLRTIGLSDDLFINVSPKIVALYRTRAATESIWHLRRHREAVRYTLMASFCWQRSQEVTDNLVELLNQIIHQLSRRAERRVSEKLTQDLIRVSGKYQLLYRIACATLEHPKGKIEEVIYPIAPPQILQQLVAEFQSTGTTYHRKVHTVIRRSYQHHYRRMLNPILKALEFRSNNEYHQPVIQALELLKKYVNSSQRYYAPDEIVPLEGILRSSQQEIFLTEPPPQLSKIERINYEIAVLQALRDRLRSREIWVVGANRYRNPEADLPADFEIKRHDYYQALRQPIEAEEFIDALKERMQQALSTLNDNLPDNPKVKLLSKNNGRIRLSPLSAQPEPVNLLHLKTELIQRWPMTSLLDILKETDLRVDFSECFQTAATRETLDRRILQKRLLLCLYGLGTNAGLKRISNGTPDVSYEDLRYIKRRFIHKDYLRQAIICVVNATLQVRAASIWGEGTVACASDSKKFGTWDQNLMSEWHFRYGGRGVMVYWHVEKKAACIYSQLKSCSSSEVAAMIEGVLRHDTKMNVKKNYVDTHGQSEIAFAFCHLLGFELLPRLKRIHEQKLYRPEAGNHQAYPNLQPILTRAIKWDLIAAQYDQIIKYATALRLGTADPESILQRFTRSPLKHPTYQALGELGKAIKTIFLARYLNSEALRQEIHEGLNVVENWNSANHFIFYGKSGEISSNNRTEQELSVLALHLLQMCLVYVNTLMLQQVLAEPEWRQRLTPEDKRGLTPLIYGHVNPYGTFELDLSERLTLELSA